MAWMRREADYSIWKNSPSTAEIENWWLLNIPSHLHSGRRGGLRHEGDHRGDIILQRGSRRVVRAAV